MPLSSRLSRFERNVRPKRTSLDNSGRSEPVHRAICNIRQILRVGLPEEMDQVFSNQMQSKVGKKFVHKLFLKNNVYYIVCIYLFQVENYGKYCEQLANLCTLVDYNFDSLTVCSLFRQLASGMPLPQIYFDEASNHQLLIDDRISIGKKQARPPFQPPLPEQIFSMGNYWINLQEFRFVVKRYGLDGSYENIVPLNLIFPSKCCTGRWRTETTVNANSRYSCRFKSNDLNAASDAMHFFELFLVDPTKNGTQLISVPLRVMNFIRAGFPRNQVGQRYLANSDLFHDYSFLGRRHPPLAVD